MGRIFDEEKLLEAAAALDEPLTTTELAKKMGAPERTIYRWISALHVRGIAMIKVRRADGRMAWKKA